MNYVPAIAAAAALALGVSAAAAAPKHHHRYVRPPRAAVVEPAPPSGFGPPHMFEARPGVFISTYGCIQDEGYGRWTYCGQGRS